MRTINRVFLVDSGFSTVDYGNERDVESERDFSPLDASDTLRRQSPWSFLIEKLGFRPRSFGGLFLILATAHFCHQVQINI